MLRLYHGTNLSSAFDIWLHGIDLNKSLPNLDFGKGFYVTDDEQKAIERALKKTYDYNRRYKCNEDAFVVEILVDEEMFSQMKIKRFVPREQEWFEFVINNRLDLDYLQNNKINNHNKDNRYDIVFGEIADGAVASLANEIKQNISKVNDIDYFKILPKSGEYYCNQYSFHTEKAISCICDVSCAIIKPRKKRKKVESL